MSARQRYLFAALIMCAPASAEPFTAQARDELPSHGLSAVAARVAAPFGLITSTFRTVEHNRAVGGVPDSYHLLGQAIDIVRRPGVSHARIAKALAAAGFHLIESLDEGDHSHFAFGLAARKATPSVKSPPEPPRSANFLAADQHGTLRVDSGGQPDLSRRRDQSTGSLHRAVR